MIQPIRNLHMSACDWFAAWQMVGVALVTAALCLGCRNEASDAPVNPVSLTSEVPRSARPGVDSLPADGVAKCGSSTELPEDGPSGIDAKVDTERLSKLALQVLKEIGKSLSHGSAPPEDELNRLVSPEIKCGNLRPQPMQPIFAGPKLTVVSASSGSSDGSAHVGIKEFRDQLIGLLTPFKSTAEIRVWFKVFRVEVGTDDVHTRAFYEATGTTPEGVLQQRGVWHCSWQPSVDGSSMRLTSVDTSDLEETLSNVDQGLLFSDCTQTVLAGNAALADDLTVGILEWV